MCIAVTLPSLFYSCSKQLIEFYCLLGLCRKVKVQQTQDVTSSLLELRQLLQTQVESNATSVRALANSSTAIATTKTKMEGIGANMKTSDRLISKYESRERTDKVLIAAAVLLFFGVVVFIIQKRLLGWIW